MHNTATPHRRRGFTLVEILTVIVIIGILAAIAVPAIGVAVRRGKQTAQKAELTALSQAIEQYAQKYGDYPPDGSSLPVFQRHMRKLFPRMSAQDNSLLLLLTDNSSDPSTYSGTFSGVAMDRGEALVFFLGGFSSDLQNPLTGAGGPLEFKDYLADGDTLNLDNYQYNATRENKFFDFEPTRLTIARATETSPLISTDEALLDTVDAVHGGNDLFPSYLAVEDQAAPILYFDSRTYGVVIPGSDDLSTANVYNGFIAPDVGGVRPYKTELAAEPPPSGGYGGANNRENEALAFAAFQFHNPDTYQLISPGLDGLFGSIVSTTPGTPGATPTVHFVTETGRPVQPLRTATTKDELYFTHSALGTDGFQDSEWGSLSENGHLDNITNFSNLTLEGDLE